MSKAVKKATSYVKDVVKETGRMISSPFEAAWHAGEAVGNLLQGDLSGAGKSLSKAAGDFTRGSLDAIGGIFVPKAVDMAANLSSAATSYATGNFNVGSDYLTKATGYDIKDEAGKAAERAAQAEYQRQVDEANAAAERNRRAELLRTRKSLTPSLSRASQGGGGAQASADGTGGIILG